MTPGLVYVDDTEPGLARRRRGRGFTYLDVDGRPLDDQLVVARLRSLAVPPAWTDVWFCADPDGHIQATGRDAKGRKQYRYHAEWQRARNEAKFESLRDFGGALAGLRERVGADMRRGDLSAEHVVATTVWLLDKTLIRIGNVEYSRDSFGLTTLLCKHVKVAADTLRFRFVGKSGKPHDVVLSDRRVARIVAKCQELPGQKLLQCVTRDGNAGDGGNGGGGVGGGGVRGIGSRDVNDYIREVTSTDFTAKTFRTWGASVHAMAQLRELDPPATEGEATARIREVVKATAERLRNTPAVCRQSYVHPAVLDAYADGSLRSAAPRVRGRARELLADDEARLLTLLRTKP
ncbi:MAG: hypothetical protein WAS51_12310 [Ilumatobacteraceae bacterium]